MKLYLSHPIMGHLGLSATPESMENNCLKAIHFANWVRGNFDVELHVPAEFEKWVNVAYMLGVVSIEDILRVDCKIISTCDGIIFYCFEDILSNGMQKESDFARANKIPRFYIKDFNYETKEKLEKFLERIKQ